MKRFDLRPQPLEATAFAPFGAVIAARGDRPAAINERPAAINERPAPMNEGWAERLEDLARIESLGDGAYTRISIVRARPMPTPIRVSKLERHPLGSQTFVPLGEAPLLVLVAPDAAIDPSALRLFATDGRQGVHYRRNVWHHFVLALHAPSHLAVIDRDGPGDNLEEYVFKDDVEIWLYA